MRLKTCCHDPNSIARVLFRGVVRVKSVMGLPRWAIAAMGVYWTTEVAFLHGKQMRNLYRPNDDGNYELTWGFWWKMNQNGYWMTTHGIAATVAFYLWMFQLSDSVRLSYPWFHRFAGRTSLLLFVATTCPTPVLAWNLDLNMFGKFMFMLLGFASMSYAWGSYVAIVRFKDVSLHRQLAFRLYSCGAAFAIFGRISFFLAYLLVEQPAAQNIATPAIAIITLVTMEFGAYQLEKDYNGNGCAPTYRVLGIPSLELRPKTTC